MHRIFLTVWIMVGKMGKRLRASRQHFKSFLGKKKENNYYVCNKN